MSAYAPALRPRSPLSSSSRRSPLYVASVALANGVYVYSVLLSSVLKFQPTLPLPRDATVSLINRMIAEQIANTSDSRERRGLVFPN